MNFLIIIFSIGFVFSVLTGGLFLNFILKILKLEKFKYKKSVLFVFIYIFFSFILYITFSLFIKSEIILFIISLILGFIVFYYLLKRYLDLNWKKSLKVYALYNLFNLALFIMLIIVVFFVRLNMYEPFVLRGASMEPTYKNNDYLIINKIDKDFKRNDVVVYENKDNFLVSRIIGLPNDKIEIKDGKVFLNENILNEDFINIETKGKFYLTLKENEYFVLGDNRNKSLDSRSLGPINKDSIRGKIFYENSELMNLKSGN